MKNQWYEKGSNIMKDDECVEIKEVKDLAEASQGNKVRLYKYAPHTFCFQIRTHKGILPYGKGAPRNMIANCYLSLDDLRKMLKYAEFEMGLIDSAEVQAALSV